MKPSTTLSTLRSRYYSIKQRRTAAATATEGMVDPDYLVDYEEPANNNNARKRTLSLISASIGKCRQKMAAKEQSLAPVARHPSNQYTCPSSTTSDTSIDEKSATKPPVIKRPHYTNASTGETIHPPITMSLIRSVILQQYCEITKEEDLAWYEEGLKWLAHQNQQNKNNTARYYIEEEKHYTGWDENRINYQYDLEDLERACEAYFSIPLGLCEDHWAADYLLTQASKKSLLFKRVNLFRHINKKTRTAPHNNSGRLCRVKRLLLCCFGI